jgi:O-antigen ligase
MFPLALENGLTTRRSLDWVAGGMVLSGTAVSVIGIGQYVFGISGASSWVDSDMFSDITVRVYSTLQNPNVLAEYLLLVIPISVALLFSAKSWTWRGIWLGCCGVMCLCMVLTFSRGGWLGLIIAAGVFVLLWQPRLLVLAPFALIALYFVLPDTVITRLTSVGNLKDSSTT